MKRIAIIGSGITGLAAAHGLRKHDYHVTLYSDRTPQQWLDESRPTGTAGRFPTTLAYERELGLNHWDDVAPRGEGVFLTFCPKLHKQLIRLFGRGAFQAIDVRLQSHRWMQDLGDRGGRIIIENVTPERLEAIAAQHDLTIVAAGRADLCKLFPRDDARSVFSAPKRNLAMVVTTGGAMAVDGCPFLPVKFDFLGTDGEVFFVPYHHKDHGPSWNILFEAQPGSRIDRFGDAKSGEDALAIAKKVIRELFPWDDAWVRDMKLADPNGWLVGKVTPMVRKPVATLPSGRVVAALGDTAISYDPIAAQGANSGIKQARHLVESILAHGDRPYDAQFLTNTFDEFYDDFARYACLFSNLFLDPITRPAQELLIAQFGSDGRTDNFTGQQKIANAFFENFNDPTLLTEALLDMPRARTFIRQATGQSWMWNAIRGRAAVLTA